MMYCATVSQFSFIHFPGRTTHSSIIALFSLNNYSERLCLNLGIPVSCVCVCVCARLMLSLLSILFGLF